MYGVHNIGTMNGSLMDLLEKNEIVYSQNS